MAIGYGIHYQKGVIFDKASEYLVFCGDRAGTTMHIDTTYQGTKDIQIKELADYQANFQIDPAYVVNDSLSYDTKLQKHFNTPMIINLLDGSVVEFSKVSYEENGKQKPQILADIIMNLEKKRVLQLVILRKVMKNIQFC